MFKSSKGSIYKPMFIRIINEFLNAMTFDMQITIPDGNGNM